jgi:hypothetical protein
VRLLRYDIAGLNRYDFTSPYNPNDGATCSQRNFCDIRWAASEDIPSVRVEKFEVDGFVKTGEGP